jgi:hypothetical protein
MSLQNILTKLKQFENIKHDNFINGSLRDEKK